MIEQSRAKLPTAFGDFDLLAFADDPKEAMPHLAIVSGIWSPETPVLVRLHSECFTGDVLGSMRCDCGPQLHRALEMIAQEGGVVIYLRQEGRGIGLINKLKAYTLQEQGADTVQANVRLGLEVDGRQYSDAIKMLELLGVKKVRLLTNNPLKVNALLHSEIELVERVPIVIPETPESRRYLHTKRDYFNHWL